MITAARLARPVDVDLGSVERVARFRPGAVDGVDTGGDDTLGQGVKQVAPKNVWRGVEGIDAAAGQLPHALARGANLHGVEPALE